MEHFDEASVLDWYADFLSWMRESRRYVEVLEIISDCSNELFLNALTAQHMRCYGRARGMPLFWARCEWEKTDVCFGQATERFRDWNPAWNARTTGDLGVIEAKLTYSNQAPSDRESAFRELARELNDRATKYPDYPKRQAYLGLVWHYRYMPGKQVEHDEWATLFGAAGLAHVICPAPESANDAGFVSVGEIDLNGLWPLNYKCRGELLLTLRRWRQPDG